GSPTATASGTRRCPSSATRRASARWAPPAPQWSPRAGAPPRASCSCAGTAASHSGPVNTPSRPLRSVLRFRPIETDRRERRLRKAASVEDLRLLARRRLPRGVFDYVDGGAEAEQTLAANPAAFAAGRHRPKVASE